MPNTVRTSLRLHVGVLFVQSVNRVGTHVWAKVRAAILKLLDRDAFLTDSDKPPTGHIFGIVAVSKVSLFRSIFG